jgi:ATP-binding cassette subfamily B protein
MPDAFSDADRPEPSADPGGGPPAAAAADPGGRGDCDPPAPPGEFDAEELALPYWLTSTDEAANTSFLRMARRLPKLLKDAWLLAWQAGPRIITAVVGRPSLGYGPGTRRVSEWSLADTR